MKKLIIPAVLVVLAGAAWALMRGGSSNGEQYRFVEITRGDVTSVVSSTGVLEAPTAVVSV